MNPMSRLFLISLILVSLVECEWVNSQNDKNIMNDLYRYEILDAGSIKPNGWIRKQLKEDLEKGYIGQFDRVHPTVTNDVFVNQNRLSKRKLGLRKEWWSGEHEGYWKDAVIRMAFLTGDKEYQERGKKWIYEIIENTGEEGYIGIYADCDKPNCRFHHVRGNGELWATSRILMAFLAYYEFTGDKKVLEAAEKSAKLIMQKYKDENYFAVTSKGGGVSHGIGFFENLEWLYRLTGNKEYIDFAEKLYADFNEGIVRDDDLKTPLLLEEDLLFHKHGAHIAEGLFVPGFIAATTNKPEYKQAAENVIPRLSEHMTPGGAMRCDEWIRGRKGSADELYEYCGIAEMISPLNKIISFTGNLSLADSIETMTFNAGQGSRFPVLEALSYLTSDNRIKINHREIAKRQSYDAAHLAAACCVLNGGRLMPYYVEGMWMKDTKNDGLLALMYGPVDLTTEVKNTKVHIKEETHYPFNDRIKFIVEPEKEVNFPLILRKPYQCENVEIDAPGAEIKEEEDRIVISKKWKKGDEVDVHFPFEVKKIKQAPSKTVKNTGIYFKRGALVYALPFEHKIKRVKEYRNSGFYRYRIKASDKRAWNFKLDNEEDVEFIPKRENQDVGIPWDDPVLNLKVWLENPDGEKESFLLVPMGNTIFRRVTFSVGNSNKK
jgi:hypothetical protein